MDVRDLTGDQLETELIRLEQAIARLRRLQCRLVAEADPPPSNSRPASPSVQLRSNCNLKTTY